MMHPILAVVEKDIRSELRTRYGVSSLALFVITTVTLIVFAMADEKLARPIAAGISWVVVFTTAMNGLGRGFISEEERGTALLLRLMAPSYAVYAGKLVVNCLLGVGSALLASILFAFFLPTVEIASPFVYIFIVIVGSAGLATVLTIVSAIVAKAGGKQAVLPVLSFPMVLPLLIPGVNAMIMAMSGFTFMEVLPDVLLMIAYSGIVAAVSWLVFDILWLE